MMRSWFHRVSTLLLALVFVTGSIGLSTADALAFHSAGASTGLTGPHYEPAGSICGHADRCVLGVTLPGPRLATPAAPVARPAQRAVPAFLPPLLTLARVVRHPLPQPRAPPPPAG